MIRKATAASPAYNQHGALLIKTSITTQGVISLYVTAGNTRIAKLSKAFTNRAQAAAWYRHVATAAEAGKPVYAIEWEVEALIAAGTAIDVEAVAEAINADGAEYVAAETAAHNVLVEDVANIMAGSQGFRGGQTRAAITSNPMDRIITDAAQRDGRIVRSRQATSTQLIALNKRGLVDLTYGRRSNTRLIVGARLTSKGFKHAGVEQRSAA